MKKLFGYTAILACALAMGGCASLYTQASPLPSATNMLADCTAHPGSLSCDMYSLLTGLCNGNIAIPISFGNINQMVCQAQGYRTAPNSSLKMVAK